MSMPIRCISSFERAAAVTASNCLNGPQPVVGSLPRKKFRLTLMSGITARSWYTVATPASSASRGEPKRTVLPSTARVPPSGSNTPDRILIRVDLPAPLSPSRQTTSPALTASETSSRATTAPKYFETLRASRRGVRVRGSAFGADIVPVIGSPHSADPGEATPDPVVQDDGHEEKRPDGCEVPVGVDARKDDADSGHPEGEGADRRPHDGPVAAGEDRPADDRRGNGVELDAATAEHVRREEGDALDRREDRGRERGQGEQRDLDPGNRDTEIAGCARGTADAGDPVAEARPSEDVRPDDGDEDPPEDRDLEVTGGAAAPVEDPGDWIRLHPVPAEGDVRDVRDLRGDRLGHPPDDEQGGQGDDERRQAGSDDDDAVDHDEACRGSHGDDDREPDRQPELDDKDADHDPGEADERSNRQVELAGDHQQRDRRPYDPDLGRDVEVAQRPLQAKEDEASAGDRDAGEHKPDEEHDDRRAGRRASEEPLEERHPAQSRRRRLLGCAGRHRRHDSLPNMARAEPESSDPARCAGWPAPPTRLAEALRRESDDVRGAVLGDKAGAGHDQARAIAGRQVAGFRVHREDHDGQVALGELLLEIGRA